MKTLIWLKPDLRVTFILAYENFCHAKSCSENRDTINREEVPWKDDEDEESLISDDDEYEESLISADEETSVSQGLADQDLAGKGKSAQTGWFSDRQCFYHAGF